MINIKGKDNGSLSSPSIETPDYLVDILLSGLRREIDKHHNCAGLAAIQIYRPYKAFIVRFMGKIYEFVNLVIVKQSGPYKIVEGCMSLPGKNYWVERYNKITTIDDKNNTKEWSGVMAQIIQHEYDHTMGIMIDDIGVEVK